MQANMGVAGEFRVVVKRADGSTKIDTGYQKNLILNQGLDFFGGNDGSDMMAYCVIGSGNSQPSYTQNKLDTALAGITGSNASTKYDYNAATDGNLYKTNKVRKYSFSGLNNVNVSELGLASTYNSATTYFLCTRALIKDSLGNPTTITVLSGEILEIYYKLWAVYDVTGKTGQINLLDGVGGSTPYKYTARMAGVGGANLGGSANYGDIVGQTLYYAAGNNSHRIFDGNIGTVQTSPTGSIIASSGSDVLLPMDGYTNGAYKRSATWSHGVSGSNGNVRSAIIFTSMGFYQIQYGSVTNDAPITKNNTQTLTIPIEISWGRYEGAL